VGKRLIHFFIIVLLLIIFKNWIFYDELSSGDFGYFSVQHVEGIKFLGIWDPTFGGMGSSVLSSLWFKAYTSSFVKASLLIGWNNYVHVFWYFPYLIFSFFSAMFLFRTLFKNNPLSWVAGFMYIANTYSLMVVAGGQMGVALAYAFAPFVLAAFIKHIDRFSSQTFNFKLLISNLKLPIISGLLFSILVMLDLRLAYITLSAIGLYLAIKLSGTKVIKGGFLNSCFLLLASVVMPLGITGLLHAYWLLPAIFSGGYAVEQLGDIYTSSESVKFFSFAKLENTLSLLHPNWPENLFGKVYFMRWEFLVLPIITYASLLFVGKAQNKSEKNTELIRQERKILFFALLGLVGAFLAKGANEPFGKLYIWLFDHVPGFIMFRDPTKWYLLIAMSYSVLIPFSIWSVYKWFSTCVKFSVFNFKFSVKSTIFNFQNVLVLLLISYFLYLLHPALLGQLNGTLKHTEIPNEYARLESFISPQPNFFRTLWVPAPQRFGFYSSLHPAIPARAFFNTTDNPKILKNFDKDKTKQVLADSGVKYVIIPYDSQGEIFLEDRKYDERQYLTMVKRLQSVTWLREIDGFGKIKVFEVGNAKDHFYFPNCDLPSTIHSAGSGQDCGLEYTFIDQTKYLVTVKNVKKDDVLVFSEGYDRGWELKIKDEIVKSKKYNERFNSFVLPEDGSYDVEVYYAPQRWVDIGIWISLGSLIVILGSLVVLRKRV
jgi:hypothetical protein